MSGERVEVVPVIVFPWLTLELPRELVDSMTPGELADCIDAARHEVVRLLRLRAGGPTHGGVS